jgi:hypothetical protein
MAPTPPFGELQPVELRQCWPDEARDLTPWVAGEQGLKLLGQAIGVELSCENCEVPVGPFSADILARDLTTNSLVVIENQLERTNHDHFGKTLTYAAVLGASAVVWVARVFTEEHRKALEWLNDLTRGDLQLYGVELQVWRIGQSAPAPRFEVVCSPNELVQAAARARDSEASPTKQLQFEFWSAVRDALKQTGQFASLQTPRGQYWFDIALGRSYMNLSLTANTFDERVGLRIYLGGRVANAALQQLEPQRQEIEAELGERLEWNPHPEKSDKVIRLTRDADIADRSKWPEIIQWLTQRAVSFKEVFGPRLMTIDLSTAESPSIA